MSNKDKPVFTYQIYTADVVMSAVTRMARNLIDIINKDKNRRICIAPVLQGGSVLGAYLLQIISEGCGKLPDNVVVHPVQTSSYHRTIRGSVKVIKDLPEDGQFDVVIFCDDICDSGNTLFTLVERAQLRGIQAVSVVLLDRQRSDRMIAPTFAAIKDSRAGWWFGFGMDDPTGGGRNDLFLSIWE